jgi:hypothetical protein
MEEQNELTETTVVDEQPVIDPVELTEEQKYNRAIERMAEFIMEVATYDEENTKNSMKVRSYFAEAKNFLTFFNKNELNKKTVYHNTKALYQKIDKLFSHKTVDGFEEECKNLFIGKTYKLVLETGKKNHNLCLSMTYRNCCSITFHHVEKDIDSKARFFESIFYCLFLKVFCHVADKPIQDNIYDLIDEYETELEAIDIDTDGPIEFDPANNDFIQNTLDNLGDDGVLDEILDVAQKSGFKVDDPNVSPGEINEQMANFKQFTSNNPDMKNQMKKILKSVNLADFNTPQMRKLAANMARKMK